MHFNKMWCKIGLQKAIPTCAAAGDFTESVFLVELSGVLLSSQAACSCGRYLILLINFPASSPEDFSPFNALFKSLCSHYFCLF